MQWKQFFTKWTNEFDQGNHVTIIGPNGSGKTLVARELVSVRRFVVALGVKHKDPTFQELTEQFGYKRIVDWSKKGKSEKLALWPKTHNLETVNREQRRVFQRMFNDIYSVGGWTIWCDEARVLTDLSMLGLRSSVQRMLVAGRSNNISMVCATQRPSWVPQEAYSEAKHLIIFRTNHIDDLKKVGSFNGVSSKEVVDKVGRLERYQFLHVNLLTGDQTVSKYEN